MNDYFAHSSALIEKDVAIGEGAKIWHGAHIRTLASIGDESTVGGNVFIDSKVVVGSRCKIQNNALLYRGVVLEDGVFVGPGVIVSNDKYPRALRPDGEMKTAEDWSIAKTIVMEGASIGAGAVIVAGVRVGAWASVGAGAVVVEDIPAHALAVGVPCRQIGWACYCGKAAENQCRDCGWVRDESQ